MPTYEYRCTKCNHGFDLVQSFHDAPLVDCPECKAPGLQKVIHAAGIVFKGSGFYKTDSSSSSVIPAGIKQSTPPATASETKTETSTTSSEPSTSAQTNTSTEQQKTTTPTPTV